MTDRDVLEDLIEDEDGAPLPPSQQPAWTPHYCADDPGTLPYPFDPKCGRYARDMEELDSFREPDESREQYARGDGTYNRYNGHFLCDTCYIKAGQPSSPFGWTCP